MENWYFWKLIIDAVGLPGVISPHGPKGDSTVTTPLTTGFFGAQLVEPMAWMNCGSAWWFKNVIFDLIPRLWVGWSVDCFGVERRHGSLQKNRWLPLEQTPWCPQTSKWEKILHELLVGGYVMVCSKRYVGKFYLFFQKEPNHSHNGGIRLSEVWGGVPLKNIVLFNL